MGSVTNVDIYKFLELDQIPGSKLEAERKCNDHVILKMLEEGLHTDITLVAQGGSVKAHRSVLASVSPVFCTMFQHNMKEQLTSIVDLPDMTIDGLQLFLLVLYTTNEHTTTTGRIMSMPQLFGAAIDKHFDEFWEAIHKYQVVRRRLQPLVQWALVRNLSPDNCWHLYEFSLQVDGQNGGLSTACHKYILDNFATVILANSVLMEMRRNPERVRGFMVSAMASVLCEAGLESVNKAKKTPQTVENRLTLMDCSRCVRFCFSSHELFHHVHPQHALFILREMTKLFCSGSPLFWISVN